ncbi:hypothetical protein [Dactylosporangium sp. NPDC050588]
MNAGGQQAADAIGDRVRNWADSDVGQTGAGRVRFAASWAGSWAAASA